MTETERHARKADVRAAEQNFRDVIARSVPAGSRRRRAVDHARAARAIAVKAIEAAP